MSGVPVVLRRVAIPAVLAALMLSGCSSQASDSASVSATTVSSSAALVATGNVPTVPNDMANNSISRKLEVPGEQFGLTVDYWTTIDAAAWQTLQPKTVHLSVHLQPTRGSADVPEVLMGSMTAVTALAAAMPGLDGLQIAGTVDTPTAVPGYLITADFPFDSVVPIEGYSEPLLQRWQALAGDQPLTEQALVDAGVYANRLSFTYRLLVRNKGDAGYHQRVVGDMVTVAEAVPDAGSTSTSTSTGTGAGAPSSTAVPVTPAASSSAAGG